MSSKINGRLSTCDQQNQSKHCTQELTNRLKEVKMNSELYPIALDDHNSNFVEPSIIPKMFLFDTPNKYVDVSIFWVEFDVLEIRYFSLLDVTKLFIVFENSIDHFGLFKGCLLEKSKLFKHIQNKLYYWCDKFDSGSTGLDHESKFSKFVWHKTIEILNDFKLTNCYVGFSHVDEIPNEYTIFQLLNERERTGVMYQDGTFFYGNHNLIHDTIYITDNHRNFSYPYPVIWPQEAMIRVPADFKYRECFSDCPKLNYGVHLSPWPNPVTEVIKYLMCSECGGRSIKRVIEHCEKDGGYKTLMPGGRFFKIIPKPTVLPRYLSLNMKRYQSFFSDYHESS